MVVRFWRSRRRQSRECFHVVQVRPAEALNLPSTQGSHVRFDDALDAVFWYSPATHVRHAVQLERSAEAEKSPSAQVAHARLLVSVFGVLTKEPLLHVVSGAHSRSSFDAPAKDSHSCVVSHSVCASHWSVTLTQ